MALPSVLSEKGLSRFRTKLCERILATGSCSFGERCQYAHTDRPRRNPHKVKYAPTRCLDVDTCTMGENCGFAHTRDEELYHPMSYKTKMCLGGNSCQGFYCPAAHTPEELRSSSLLASEGDSIGGSIGGTDAPTVSSADAVDGSTGGAPQDEKAAPPPAASVGRTLQIKNLPKRGTRDSGQCADISVVGSGSCGSCTTTVGKFQASSESLPGARTGGASPAGEQVSEDFWYAGDQRDVRVNQRDVLPNLSGDGDVLLGGTLRPGFFISKKTTGSFTTSEHRCIVKLLPINRGDSRIASQVVKEVRRWIAQCGGEECAFALRRTVATTILAIPERPSTIGSSVRPLPSLPAPSISMAVKISSSNWQLLGQAATWVGQVVQQVQALHAEGIAHLCIGPQTVMVDAQGVFHLGDFLGKIRILRTLDSTPKANGKVDEVLGMWLPAEVHRRIASSSASDSRTACDEEVHSGSKNCWQLDLFRVDSWQLGVTLFYLLTGEHLYGDTREPQMLCRNILLDWQANRALLKRLPLLSDLIARLTDRRPDRRITPAQARRHPALWAFSDAARLGSALVEACKDTASVPTITDTDTHTAAFSICEWLRHLPPFASLGIHEAPPLDPRIPVAPETLTGLCDMAIACATLCSPGDSIVAALNSGRNRPNLRSGKDVRAVVPSASSPVSTADLNVASPSLFLSTLPLGCIGGAASPGGCDAPSALFTASASNGSTNIDTSSAATATKAGENSIANVASVAAPPGLEMPPTPGPSTSGSTIATLGLVSPLGIGEQHNATMSRTIIAPSAASPQFHSRAAFPPNAFVGDAAARTYGIATPATSPDPQQLLCGQHTLGMMASTSHSTSQSTFHGYYTSKPSLAAASYTPSLLDGAAYGHNIDAARCYPAPPLEYAETNGYGHAAAPCPAVVPSPLAQSAAAAAYAAAVQRGGLPFLELPRHLDAFNLAEASNLDKEQQAGLFSQNYPQVALPACLGGPQPAATTQLPVATANGVPFASSSHLLPSASWPPAPPQVSTLLGPPLPLPGVVTSSYALPETSFEKRREQCPAGFDLAPRWVEVSPALTEDVLRCRRDAGNGKLSCSRAGGKLGTIEAKLDRLLAFFDEAEETPKQQIAASLATLVSSDGSPSALQLATLGAPIAPGDTMLLRMDTGGAQSSAPHEGQPLSPLFVESTGLGLSEHELRYLSADLLSAIEAAPLSVPCNR